MLLKRFTALNAFVVTYLLLSFIIRFILLVWVGSEIEFSILGNARTLTTGLFFDIGSISFFALFYSFYLLLVPRSLYGSKIDRAVTYSTYALLTFIILFVFFAEITFWEEFKSRFNFIAVDYLIYTYEVVRNINESYPLPLLIGGIILIELFVFYVLIKRKVFEKTFNNQDTFKLKLIPFAIWLLITVAFVKYVENKDAEWSKNRYSNEISKSGIYSFFNAFRTNEMPFDEFYLTLDIQNVFNNVKSLVYQENDNSLNKKNPLARTIAKVDSSESQQPNVIFICIESLSASFLSHYGNEQKLTPILDSLIDKSVFFSNLFATGTRTIRGMEAITLSIPPTPGSSIVKRPNNSNLFSIGEVFKQKGYSRSFFYGGDGYFDNMNQFFGGNGFDIVDRGRGYLMGDEFKVKRINIADSEVQFENAWGICDEDIYNKVIQQADINHKIGKSFFNFVMTTSNHRPYTYPENTVSIPSGAGREGAVMYTDYAIGQFLKKAQSKPWFDNTVFVIMSDHCASSAGSQDLDVANYKIPAMIFNLKNHSAENVSKLCSQIDVFPTLFSLLNWEYESWLFGKNIYKMKPNEERALVGNYLKVGLLEGDKITVLNNKKEANYYQWKTSSNELVELPKNKDATQRTISYYQSASYIFNTGLLKLKN